MNGKRLAGWSLLTLVLAGIIATAIFPIVAGVLRLGMNPGVTGFQSLTRWCSFAWGLGNQPAQWHVFWSQLRSYLYGQYLLGPTDLSALPKALGVTSGLAIIVAAGLTGSAIYTRWNQGSGKPQVNRQHLRGARLLGVTARK